MSGTSFILYVKWWYENPCNFIGLARRVSQRLY